MDTSSPPRRDDTTESHEADAGLHREQISWSRRHLRPCSTCNQTAARVTGSTGQRQSVAVRSLITRRSQVQILPPPLDEMPGNVGFPGISHFRREVRLPRRSTGSLVSESLTCEFATPPGRSSTDHHLARGRSCGLALTAGGGEQRCEVGCGGCTHAGKQKLVGGHREPGMGMPEPFRHDLDRFAGCDE